MRIGRERLRQILRERGITFQRTRTWKESAGPDNDTKLDVIEHVPSKFPGRCFAFDQFGPLSIRPCQGSCWAPRKNPARLPATYHRTHGTGTSTAATRWAMTSCGRHPAAQGRRPHPGRPEEHPGRPSDGAPIYVIMDNLSANKTPGYPHLGEETQGETVLYADDASWGQSDRSAVRAAAYLCHGRF